MTETRSPDGLDQHDEAGGATAEPPRRRRRGLRIALISLASLLVLFGATAASAFIYVNHEVGSIPRIPVKFLAAKGSTGGMTMLLTDSQVGPTGLSAPPETPTGAGLIMLLHINGDQSAGGAVSLPPQVEVKVPGHGTMPLSMVTAVGGASLLTATVHNLTGVPINHFATIDFNHVDGLVNALGGVSVTLPRTEVSFGHVFHKGVNHVNGTEALEYARQPSVTEAVRVQRQSSLVRAVFTKLAQAHLLTHPVTTTRVLNALVGMLTVDSTFTNSQILSLATDLGHPSGGAITYVSAPTKVIHGEVKLNPTESRLLWAAIETDSIAQFARQFPATVTPAAP